MAILALVAVAGIPAGWYSKGKVAEATVAQPAPPAPEAQTSSEDPAAAPQEEQPTADPNSAEETAAVASTGDANALAAKRAREARERARMTEALATKQGATANPSVGQPADAVKKPEAAKPAPKMVTVQVTYDEAGRVTQTSGGDGTAQRIARQKRFPAGKPGTSTVTIPIN